MYIEVWVRPANVIQALKPIPTFRVSDRREFQCVGSVAAAVGAGWSQSTRSRACLRSADRHAEKDMHYRRTQAHTDAVQGHGGHAARCTCRCTHYFVRT